MTSVYLLLLIPALSSTLLHLLSLSSSLSFTYASTLPFTCFHTSLNHYQLSPRPVLSTPPSLTGVHFCRDVAVDRGISPRLMATDDDGDSRMMRDASASDSASSSEESDDSSNSSSRMMRDASDSDSDSDDDSTSDDSSN